MKHDFTSIVDRCGGDAIAVDGLGSRPEFASDPPKKGFDIIPIRIADMNFPTVPTIPEAMVERAKHPAYGYFNASDAYYESIVQWQKVHNDMANLTRECIGYESGVLGGIVSTPDVFPAPGDAVSLHSPACIGSIMSIGNCGYKIVHSPLKLGENGVWKMDYKDMDAKVKASRIRVAVFCSPRNLCGRVRER